MVDWRTKVTGFPKNLFHLPSFYFFFVLKGEGRTNDEDRYTGVFSNSPIGGVNRSRRSKKVVCVFIIERHKGVSTVDVSTKTRNLKTLHETSRGGDSKIKDFWRWGLVIELSVGNFHLRWYQLRTFLFTSFSTETSKYKIKWIFPK